MMLRRAREKNLEVALCVRGTHLGEKGEIQIPLLQERIQNHLWEKIRGRASLEAGEKPSRNQPALLGERI